MGGSEGKGTCEAHFEFWVPWVAWHGFEQRVREIGYRNRVHALFVRLDATEGLIEW